MTLVQIKVTSWREMFSSCVSNLMPEDIYINSIFNQIHCLNFFFFFKSSQCLPNYNKNKVWLDLMLHVAPCHENASKKAKKEKIIKYPLGLFTPWHADIPLCLLGIIPLCVVWMMPLDTAHMYKIFIRAETGRYKWHFQHISVDENDKICLGGLAAFSS